MKRKILIALLVVLALSVSVLAGCNLSIMSIELKSGSLATEYYVGDAVDMSRAKITVTKSDGTTEDVALTSSMLDKAISTQTAGETTYTVTYEGKTCEIKITVREVVISVRDLATTYYVGDSVNYDDAKLAVTRGENVELKPLTKAMFDREIDTSVAAIGSKEYTVTYNGLTTKVNVTVKAPTIAVKAGTLANSYYVGDTVSFTDAKLTVTGSATRDVALTADMFTTAIDTSVAALGKKTYKINYNGAEASFEVTVLAPALELKAGTLKLDYLVGETVSIDGAKVTVKNGDRTPVEIALTQAMLDKQITTAAVGSTEYTISHNGATVKFTVVVRQVKSIDSVTGLNLTPIKGESVEFTNAKLNVTYSDDTTGQVALTADMLNKAISTATVGEATYTISYGGKTKDIVVDVQDPEVKSIKVENDFVTKYYIGYTAPDFSQTKLVITFADDSTRNIALSSAAISPALDTATAGTKEYTLTFGEGDKAKTTTLSITMVDTKLVVEQTAIKFNVGDKAYNADNELIGATIKVVGTDDHELVAGIKVTKAMLGSTVFSTDTHGDKQITITYTDEHVSNKSVNFTVNVLPVTIRLATAADFKNGETVSLFATTYRPGASVSYVGKVAVVYQDNTVKLIDIDESMFGSNAVNTAYSQAGKTTKYTLTYLDATVEIDVEVLNFTITVDDDVKKLYIVGDTVNNGGHVTVKFSDNTTVQIDFADCTVSPVIVTNKEGVAHYTVSYQGKTTDLNITTMLFDAEIQSFMLPDYIEEYERKSTTTEENDGDFRKLRQMYEVGNLNGFVLNPQVTYMTQDGQSHNTTIAFNVKVETSENGTTWSEWTEGGFITAVRANTYFFDKDNSADKYVRLTMSIPDYYRVASGVTKTRTFTFKIIDNGYNVYDQMGLAVMTDRIRPEFWADILNCDVSSSGQYVEKADADKKPVKLEATDDKYLYQYIGNVDWMVLHGSIEITPDLLPRAFFWNGDEKDSGGGNIYQGIYDAVGQNQMSDEVAKLRQELLLGSLRDLTDATHDYLITNNVEDSNNNKAIYSTSRANVSGNYATVSIKLEGDQTYTGPDNKTYNRRLVGVAHRHVAEAERSQEIGTQWHLFSICEPAIEKDDGGNKYLGWPEAHTTFTFKNLGLTGTRGNTVDDYAAVYGGLSMVHFFAKEVIFDNVVATKFHVNLSQDNYSSGVENLITISDTKIYDTFNCMAFTWRGKINITNSMLKDCGGPLFIMDDGDGGSGDSTKIPSITVDSASELEAYAQGNEPWYTQLNKAASQLFTILQTVNEQFFKTYAHKSFYTTKTGDGYNGDYINVMAIIIPETGSAFGKDNPNEYGNGNIEQRHAVRGEFTKVDAQGNVVYSYNMMDPVFTAVKASNDGGNYGGFMFHGGNNYAYLDLELNIDPSSGKVEPSKADIKPVWALEGVPAALMAAGNVGPDQLAEFGEMDPNKVQEKFITGWATLDTDTIIIWIKNPLPTPGAAYAPYLGVIVGGFHSVAAA